MNGPAVITWPDGSSVEVQLQVEVMYGEPEVFDRHGHLGSGFGVHDFEISATSRSCTASADVLSDVTILFDGVTYKAAITACSMTPGHYFYELAATEDWSRVREEARRG